MTIKEIAAELNTSKTTIKNIIKKLGIEPQKKMERGQEIIFLSESEIEKIKASHYQKHPTENPEKFTAKGEKFSANVCGKGEKITENPEKFTAKGENIEINDRLIDLLQKDLEAKNKQIEDLNARLAEAMKALNQEQQLKALAEKKILELEDKAAGAEANPAESEDKKKSLFNWFSKK